MSGESRRSHIQVKMTHMPFSDPTGITEAEYQAWVTAYNEANSTSLEWSDLQGEFALALQNMTLVQLQILIWMAKQHAG